VPQRSATSTASTTMSNPRVSSCPRTLAKSRAASRGGCAAWNWSQTARNGAPRSRSTGEHLADGLVACRRAPAGNGGSRSIAGRSACADGRCACPRGVGEAGTYRLADDAAPRLEPTSMRASNASLIAASVGALGIGTSACRRTALPRASTPPLSWPSPSRQEHGPPDNATRAPQARH
jgi:hypothetical protein